MVSDKVDDRKAGSDPDQEEGYWFSTRLEASVRGRALSDPTEKAAFPKTGETATPLADALSREEYMPDLPPPDALSIYEEARRTLGAVFSSIRADEQVEPEELERLAGQIVSNILEMPPGSYDIRSPQFSNVLVSCLYDSFGTPSDLVDHCLNVAVLGVMLAQDRIAEEGKLVRLCLAAMLHDVGMLFVPSETWEHDRPLTAKELETVQHHAELGRERVSKLGGSLSELADIVGQEHERADGSGYPRGLKGPEIEELARIIGLADVFEALTHGRPHRPARTPHQAVRTILTEMREAFDEHLLRTFLNRITIYPLGSYVELSKGEVGRVVQVNEKSQMRPVLEVLRDTEGRAVDPPTIMELQGLPLVSIVRCLDGPPEPHEGQVASNAS